MAKDAEGGAAKDAAKKTRQLARRKEVTLPERAKGKEKEREKEKEKRLSSESRRFFSESGRSKSSKDAPFDQVGDNPAGSSKSQTQA